MFRFFTGSTAFDPLTLLTLKYRGRSIAVFREQCIPYHGVLAVALRTFPSLQNVDICDIVLVAPIPGSCDTEPVELSWEIWRAVCRVVHTVTISLESEMQNPSGSTTTWGSPVPSGLLFPTPTSSSHVPLRLSPQPAQPEPLSTSKSSRKQRGIPAQSQTQQSELQVINISLTAWFMPAPLSFSVSEHGLLKKKVSRLYELIDPNLGFSASNSSLTFGRSRLNNASAISDYGIVSGDTILLNSEAKIAKPVIYLYPPSSLANVSVDLALTSSWRFSAVHPPPRATAPPGKPHTAQSLTWTVAAEPNGTLFDKTSGLEVSYLYWEAKLSTNSQLVTPHGSRATTPTASTETFNPARPSVNPGDSVLLPISDVPGYLDVALKALALHTEARTSFITYWLPDMLEHEYIALRFVAQDAYEQAAPMRIVPTPDVVTRVFMLFRGVAVGDLGLWEAASARAASGFAKGAMFWADVVGVNASRAADSGLFRVLEWGGMEVR